MLRQKAVAVVINTFAVVVCFYTLHQLWQSSSITTIEHEWPSPKANEQTFPDNNSIVLQRVS